MGLERVLSNQILVELQLHNLGDGKQCVINTSNALDILKVMGRLSSELQSLIGTGVAVNVTTSITTSPKANGSIPSMASTCESTFKPGFVPENDGTPNLADDDQMEKIITEISTQNKHAIETLCTEYKDGSPIICARYHAALHKYIRDERSALSKVKTIKIKNRRFTPEQIIEEFHRIYGAQETLPGASEAYRTVFGLKSGILMGANAGRKKWENYGLFLDAYATWLEAKGNSDLLIGAILSMGDEQD